MTEPHLPGNSKMPDFKQLNDRIILDAPSDPTLVIKTNLDPKEATEENPYYKKIAGDNEAFLDFFKE